MARRAYLDNIRGLIAPPVTHRDNVVALEESPISTAADKAIVAIDAAHDCSAQ